MLMSGSHFISLPQMKDCDMLYLFLELLFLSQNECFLFETHAMPYKWVLPPLGAFNHKNINNIRYNKLDKHRLFQISFGYIWLPWKHTNYIFCKLSQSTSAPSSAQSSYEWAYWSNQVPFFVSLSGGTWISFVKSNRQRGEINPM